MAMLLCADNRVSARSDCAEDDHYRVASAVIGTTLTLLVVLRQWWQTKRRTANEREGAHGTTRQRVRTTVIVGVFCTAVAVAVDPIHEMDMALFASNTEVISFRYLLADAIRPMSPELANWIRPARYR